ncbi:MAG: GNAT family N-acetyltransferase [Armatimonadetes bacterium]|nr:GNAT family N-acetyltransferase [Armatimonadota bacterium]
MDIEVVRDVEQFAALKDEWNDLLERSATRHIFLTHQWHYTWWEHFGTGNEGLLILLARDNGRLMGIAPLRRQRQRVKGLPLFRVLTFLLGYEADYRDFLLQEGMEWELLEVFLQYLKSDVEGWQALKLQGVHGDSVTNQVLPVVARQQGLAQHGQMGASCPYIALPPTYDEFLGRMSRSTRRKFEQKLRKLGREQGTISLEVHCGSDVTSKDMDDFLHLHEQSWATRGGSRAICASSTAAFHRELVAAMKETPWPFVSRLCVGDRTAAIIYGYVVHGVFYDYLPGSDPAFEQYSVGAQALMLTVEWGITAGWREFDLLRGDERYKFHFTRHLRHTVGHTIGVGRHLRTFRLLETFTV